MGRLQNPNVVWSATATESVHPDMTQEEWEESNRRFPRYANQKIISYS